MYEKNIAKHYKRLDKAIKFVHDHKASIRIPKLYCNSLKISVYSDAAFANTPDLSSQLGQIVLLTDDNHNPIPVSYKSYKTRSVARSVLFAEVIAFANLFDDALTIRKQLEFVLRQLIQVRILTDSKNLFDIISKGGRTSEKRIMLDIYADRKAYKVQEIRNIGFVGSSQNLANGLTKAKVQETLYQLLATAYHKRMVEQYIIRDLQ